MMALRDVELCWEWYELGVMAGWERWGMESGNLGGERRRGGERGGGEEDLEGGDDGLC